MPEIKFTPRDWRKLSWPQQTFLRRLQINPGPRLPWDRNQTRTAESLRRQGLVKLASVEGYELTTKGRKLVEAYVEMQKNAATLMEVFAGNEDR